MIFKACNQDTDFILCSSYISISEIFAEKFQMLAIVTATRSFRFKNNSSRATFLRPALSNRHRLYFSQIKTIWIFFWKKLNNFILLQILFVRQWNYICSNGLSHLNTSIFGRNYPFLLICANHDFFMPSALLKSPISIFNSTDASNCTPLYLYTKYAPRKDLNLSSSKKTNRFPMGKVLNEL